LASHTLKSHSYLGTSQSILILANEGTLIVDYKATLQQSLDIKATCTANWSEGFILAHKDITIYKYEDQQYKEKFVYENKDAEVSAISVNEDKILVLLNNGSFMTGKIKNENNKNTVKFTLEPINLHYHSSGIVGMDVCIRKPLIATASKDKTIKIWNYEEKTVETPKG
jgi:WD40 repeat protein